MGGSPVTESNRRNVYLRRHLMYFLYGREDRKQLYANSEECGACADTSSLVRHQTNCQTAYDEA